MTDRVTTRRDPRNPGGFENEILGFFGICLKSVKGLFKVRQDLLPRPLEVKIFSQWGHIWKHIVETNQMQPTWIHAGDLRRHLNAHNGERSNKCMWFCIYSGRQFETAFESSQWREAKKYIRCYFTPIKAGDLKIPPLQYKFRRETFNEDTF